MTKDKSYFLEDGIDALNEGRNKDARRLLSAAIREDPENETAWLGMAYAVDEEERHIECMRRVLEINPENETAKKVIEKFEASQKLSGAGEKVGRYGILAVIAFMAVCIPIILFSNTVGRLFSPRTATPSRIPIDFIMTETPIPSDTQSPPATAKTTAQPTLTRTMPPSPTDEKLGVEFFPCIPDSPPILAEVLQVLDGNTIEVVISNVTFPVRYVGVKAPGESSDYWENAFEINRTMVEGQEVWLYPDILDRDEEGFLLRFVFIDNLFVNYELLRLGYAAAVDFPPNNSCSVLFSETAQGAKNDSQGLWAFIDLNESALTPTPEGLEP